MSIHYGINFHRETCRKVQLVTMCTFKIQYNDSDFIHRAIMTRLFDRSLLLVYVTWILIPLVATGKTWLSHSPLNIFTCCSSIHKFKPPFFAVILTKTVTRNNSIVFRISIRPKMSINNILKQKKISTATLLRAHKRHGCPPQVAWEVWICYHGNSECWARILCWAENVTGHTQ